ncbi:hypothetical protein B0A52_00460 [Exophiala mesophila]|uniref:Probable E3 ubiquitin ligase complex SCF subunit sconB n=1 Tax=Exophiala mesophila TaxID=212818 RepID=A0A438NK59_EXOME|nr:hypothetical protein B0A52_00460 [Exophiala mesophila]
MDSYRGRSISSSSASFRLDEGFSEETASQNESSRITPSTDRFQSWVLSQNEESRAEIAYEVLRTLRTSSIAAVVERLTPLLHMDPLEKLPPEITCQIFSYLDASTLMTASLSSRTWRARVMDTMLWQDLYKSQGWGIDTTEVKAFENTHLSVTRHGTRRRLPRPGQPQLKKRVTSDWLQSRGRQGSADVSQWREQHGTVEADSDMPSEPDDQEMQDAPNSLANSPQRPNKRHSNDSGDEMDYVSSSPVPPHPPNTRKKVPPETEPPFKSRLITYDSNGGEKLNWLNLYKQRQRLEQNWTNGQYTTFQLPHPSYPREAHTECVYTIQFFGKWLVSGSRDRSLRVWDLETRRLRGKPLLGHSQSVLCLQFDPTEQEDVIISGSSDSSVIVWRFSTGERIHKIPSAHEESVLNLRFDHRYLVTCSKDRKIKIWNRKHLTAADPDYPQHSRLSSARLPSYIVNLDEVEPSLLEARIANGSIRALQPYTLLMTLEGHGAAVNAIQINGDLIVSASGDRLIRVWNVKDGRLLRSLQGHHKGIACVQFDSKRIVSGSSDNTVRIYDPFTSAEVAELKGHTNLVRTVQAGFGDMPGADDASTAREVEKKFLQAVANGTVPDDRQYFRRVRNGEFGSSRMALNSKLPPGGGGSKWGRIVSGSYDETIIIWRKNAQGDWVESQRLRQVAHTPDGARPRPSQPPNVAATLPPLPHTLAAPMPPQAPHLTQGQSSSSNVASSSNANHQAVLAATQVMQQAVGSGMAGLGSGLLNAFGAASTAGLGTWRTSSTNARVSVTSSVGPIQGQSPSTVLPDAAASISQTVQHALTQAPAQGPAVNQPQRSNISNSSGPTPGPQPQPQGSSATSQPGAQVTNNHHHHHHNNNTGGQAPVPNQHHPVAPASVSRVFKLQFDARRIVCCSQDSRIVGWDFANGDPDIAEAAKFFVGP